MVSSLQSFDLNLLKTFEALMDSRSVSLAARQLSLTQPAVSNALSRLRSLLDDPLLVRTKQGMEPTPRALALRGPVKEALRSLEVVLLPPVDFDPVASERQFTIAAPDFIALRLLDKLLPRWRTSAPGLSLRVVHLGPETPASGLEEGNVDLAIGRFLDVPGRLRRSQLSEEKLVCLLAEDNPCCDPLLDLDTFLTLPFVWVSNSGRRGMIDRWLHQQGVARQVQATVSTYASAAMLVEDSDYALVIASNYADYLSERMKLKAIPLDFDPGSFSIEMLWHAYTEGDAALKWLRSEISQVLS